MPEDPNRVIGLLREGNRDKRDTTNGSLTLIPSITLTSLRRTRMNPMPWKWRGMGLGQGHIPGRPGGGEGRTTGARDNYTQDTNARRTARGLWSSGWGGKGPGPITDPQERDRVIHLPPMDRRHNNTGRRKVSTPRGAVRRVIQNSPTTSAQGRSLSTVPGRRANGSS